MLLRPQDLPLRLHDAKIIEKYDFIILEKTSSSKPNRQWGVKNHDAETSGPTLETPGCKNN